MAASLSSRDRRALSLLGAGLALYALLQSDLLLPSGGSSASSASIQLAEERLLLAQVKARQKPVADVGLEAANQTDVRLETGLLQAETAALAQAEMRSVVGDLLRAEGITMQSSQFAATRLEGEDFAQVPLIVNFNCAIEKFVNLMAAMSNAPRLLSTRRIRITTNDNETKAIRVQLTVSGYLPASRTPELVQRTPAAGARL